MYNINPLDCLVGDCGHDDSSWCADKQEKLAAVRSLRAMLALAEKVIEAAREYTKTRSYQNVQSCREDQDRLEGRLIAQIHAYDAALSPGQGEKK